MELVRTNGLKEKTLAISLASILLTIIANPVVCQTSTTKPKIISINNPGDYDIAPADKPGVVFTYPYDDIYKWKDPTNLLVKTLKREGNRTTGFVGVYAETLAAGFATGGTEVEKLISVGKEKEITVEAEMLVTHNVGKFGILPSGVSTSKTLRIGSKDYNEEMDKFWNWQMFLDAALTVAQFIFPETKVADIIDVINLLSKINDVARLYEFFDKLRSLDELDLVYIKETNTVKPGLITLRAGLSATAYAAASYAAAVALGMVTKISVYGMDPPNDPVISCDSNWKKDIENEITITCSDKNNDDIFFKVDWGDYNEETTDFIKSGSSIKVSHTYKECGDYTIKVRAYDNDFSDNYNPDMKSELVTYNITVSVNWPPIALREPQGPTKIKIGQQATYTTSAHEHDGDPIYYKFDWFGEQTEWLGPYESDETVSASHSWSDAGTVLVCVKAIDDPNRDGDLSDGLETDWKCTSVEVPRYRNYDCSILEKFIQMYLPFLNN